MDRRAANRGSAAVHKFRVGQMVDFVPSKSGVTPSARSSQVLSVRPLEGGERLYRIKTIAEAFERVAFEEQLSRSP